MRWTTNKPGVFAPPPGVTFSTGLDNVGDNHTQGGFAVVFVNDSMSNFITTLQVNTNDIAGVQVSCSITGVTDTMTPQLAGKVNVHVHVSVAWYCTSMSRFFFFDVIQYYWYWSHLLAYVHVVKHTRIAFCCIYSVYCC